MATLGRSLVVPCTSRCEKPGSEISPYENLQSVRKRERTNCGFRTLINYKRRYNNDMILPLALWIAAKPTGDVEDSIAKLAASEGLSLSFVDREIGGATRTWTIKLQKPQFVSAECSDLGFVVDGNRIVSFEKPLKSVKTEPKTEIAWRALLARPEFFLAKLFFDPKGGWLEGGMPGGVRAKYGATLNGTKFAISNNIVATLFVNAPVKKIELVQIEVGEGSQKLVHLLDNLQMSPAQYSPGEFAFRESAEARGARLITVPSEASRRDLAEGYQAYRQLTWDDFPVSDSHPSGMAAWTQTYIRYNFRSAWKRAGNGYRATVTSLDVRSGFQPSRMWRKRSFNTDGVGLLLHEQGHVDINEIEAQKIRAMPPEQLPVGTGATSADASADLGAKLKSLIERAIAEVSRQNQLYDSETDHGRNHEAQKRWLAKIRQQL
jgi:hypothetical protein